jgi:Immunity protein 26
MTKVKKQKYSEGSIIAIPLPDGRYAFAKAFQPLNFGIYDLVTHEILPVEMVVQHPISFYQVSTDSAIKSGDWKVIGEEPFASKEDSYIPPMATCYIKETDEWTMGGVPRIQYKDDMHIATAEQVRGMDIFSVCHKPELMVKIIVDRLINGNHDAYKVPA